MNNEHFNALRVLVGKKCAEQIEETANRFIQTDFGGKPEYMHCVPSSGVPLPTIEKLDWKCRYCGTGNYKDAVNCKGCGVNIWDGTDDTFQMPPLIHRRKR